MGVEEAALSVAGRKGKKSTREKRNEGGVQDIRQSGNVVVEGDKKDFEKEGVTEKNNADKGNTKKKMMKKKLVNTTTEDRDIEGDKRIFEKGDVIKKNNVDKDDVVETNNVDKGDTEKKMKLKKKKKLNTHIEDGDIEGNKGTEDGGTLSRDGDGEAVENVDRKKKKKEKGKRKDGVGVRSDHFVDNEGDAHLLNNKMRDSDGKYGKEGEMHAEKDGEKKKKKKREKKKHKGDVSAAQQDLTAWKPMDTPKENGKRVEISGEGRDGKVMEKIEKRKMKREKKQTKDELEGVMITDESRDGEVMEKVERKQRKREKGQTKDDLKGVEKSGEDRDGKVMEKIEKKKRKREKGHTKDDVKGVETTGEGHNREVLEKVERKKRKREKGKSMDDLGAGNQDIAANTLASAEGNPCSTDNEIQGGDMENNSKGKRKKANLGRNCSDNPKAKKGKKKVRFSGQVEVFPLSADSNSQKSDDGNDKLVRGKRFSREEDEMVKEAVYKYIEEHALGEEGLNMVLNCRSHPEIKDCWQHIAKAIPYRPRTAIYYRAQVLFRRGDKRKWTEEDYELIRKFQEEHGNQWKVLAEEFGKHRFHVKDTWRRIKLLNRKKGHWAQEEYQTLFDLVNTDLQLKLSEEKKSKHGMLRDNIHWSTISDKLSTRSDASCCLKWYNQLTSPMVAEGLWADADDYRLINALFSLDASCVEDVDWDNLLDHRSGDVCRKRWNQMVLHVGQHGSKSFAEQVEILARRYLPDLIEVREAWDSKPVVA